MSRPMAETACPYCGRINDQHSSSDGTRVPHPGAISLCWGCGGLAIFTETGVRLPTPDELEECEAHPDVIAARAVIGQYWDVLAAVRAWRGAGR